MTVALPRNTDAIEGLRPARGYIHYPVADSPNRVSGWILLPDAQLDSVRLYVNGDLAGSATIEFQQEIASAYPRIPHAGWCGFQVRLRPGQVRIGEVNRAVILGCQAGRPVARFATFFFASDVVPTIPSPPAELIIKVQGTDDRELYRCWGFRYYLQLREAIARHRDPSSVRRLLDWGCGSGRVTSFFLRETDGPEVFGCDIDPDAVAWCSAHLRRDAFSRVDTTPPLPYADGTFDVIISLAVMAGFGPDSYDLWLPELRRILAPGGLFLGSVQGAFTASFEYPPATLRHLLREGIFDGGQDPERGEWRGFFLSREYVVREWSKYFEVLDYLEGEINADEDLVVARLPK